MNRIIFSFLLCLCAWSGSTQELYPFSEPASNMPARSVSVKLTSMLGKGGDRNTFMQRHMPELMLGLNKNLMVHLSTTFADMHRPTFGWESVRLYGKYRFLSQDEVHKHFRMAAFAAVAYSRNELNKNEINFMGDQSGAQAGLIATQLWNRFALSATGSWNEVLHTTRWNKSLVQDHAFSAFNYSLSGGYLLLPVTYTDYDQTNLNLYAEILGSRNSARRNGERYYVDLAPSVQLIFKSTSKLNIGYRFEMAGDMSRLSRRSIMLSYEHLFLGALQKKPAPTTLSGL